MQRKIIEYTDTELENIKDFSDIIKSEIKLLKRNVLTIYKTQYDVATEILETFKNRTILMAMVIALTQSGKTGAMLALVEKYLNTSNVDPHNIFIITGLSSNDWKTQTKSRFPEKLHKNIFHRTELSKKFVSSIKDRKNVLVIIDEIQVAAKTTQTVCSALKNSGIYDINTFYNSDIKIVEFTATPDGTLYDLLKWEDASRKIIFNPGDEYTSIFNLFDSERCKQFKKLWISRHKNVEYNCQTIDADILANVKEIYDIIIQKEWNPKYHIIRTPHGDQNKSCINHFIYLFNKNKFDYEYTTYDENDKRDLNELLIHPPEKHTFIFILEKLRCSKTLNKKYLGVLYERYTSSVNDSVVIQGLAGRCTGYDDNGKSIIFTNTDTITRYKKLWDSGFDKNEIKNITWCSNTTTTRNNECTSLSTLNDPNNVDGMSVNSYDTCEENDDPIIVSKDTREELVEFCKTELKYVEKFKNKRLRGPSEPPKEHITEDGFIQKKFERKPLKVYSQSDINEIKKWANNKNKDRVNYFPYYTDITDNTSLKWCAIYYK